MSEALCFSDPIEEPVIFFHGTGSGADCTVGNEEKKKIFFFGQPGCLKHSPIKTSPNDEQDDHKSVSEDGATTALDVLKNHKNSNEAVIKAAMDDDENGDTLLQKISAVLDDEPDSASINVKSTPTIAAEPAASKPKQDQNAEELSKSESKVIETVELEISNQNCANQETLGQKHDKVEESEVKLDNKDSVSNNVAESESKKSSFSEKVDERAEVSVSSKENPLRSIVPYDDDSTSSSSQVDIEPEKTKLNEYVNVNVEKSASDPSETSVQPDLEVTEIVGNEKFKETLTEKVEETTEEPQEESAEVTQEKPIKKPRKASESVTDETDYVQCLFVAPSENLEVKEVESLKDEEAQPENNESINESVEIRKKAEEVSVEESKPAEVVVEQPEPTVETVTEPERSASVEGDACASEVLQSVEQEATEAEDKRAENIPIEVVPTEATADESSPIEKSKLGSTPVHVEMPSSVPEPIMKPPVVAESPVVEQPALEQHQEATIENFINANAEVVEEELPNLEQAVERPRTPTEAEEFDSEIETTETTPDENVKIQLEAAVIPSPDSPVEETAQIASIVDHEVCRVEEETLIENENKLENEVEQEEISSEDKVAINDEVNKIEIEEQSGDNVHPVEDGETITSNVGDESGAGKSAGQIVTENIEEKSPEPESDEDLSETEVNEMVPIQVESSVAKKDTPQDESEPEDSEENCLLVDEHKPEETETEAFEVKRSKFPEKEQDTQNTNASPEPVNNSSVDETVQEQLKEEVSKSLEVEEDEEESEPELNDSEPLQLTSAPKNEEESKSVDAEIEQPAAVLVEEKKEPIVESLKTSPPPVKEAAALDNQAEDEDSDDEQNDFPADDDTGGDSDYSDTDQKSPEAGLRKEIEVPSATLIQDDPVEPEITLKQPEVVEPIAQAENLETKPTTPIKVKSESIKDLSAAKNDIEQATHEIEDVDQTTNKSEDVKTKLEIEEDPLKFTKPPVTRKRKISERKSASESDSEGNVATDTVSHDNTSEDEEAVQIKKPRMRGKTTTPRKAQPKRAAAAATKKPVETKKEVKEETKPEETKPEEATLQNLKFDYDENEDVAAKVAAIRTMISKDSGVKKESDSDSSDGSERKAGTKRSRRTRGGRASKRHDTDSSDEEEKSLKKGVRADPKRSKTQDESKDQSTPTKKKRESAGKGLLKYIDTSLVIDTTENEAPVRQSRRIAQQKVREESDRRQIEEKMLKQMKAQAVKKSLAGTDDDDVDAEVDENETSGDDESFKGSRRKKKSKIAPADKQWQTSSSHSERSESDDYMENIPSDPGSPLFKSDHEFSPESDDEDAAAAQPLKRARTAKKLEAVQSSDEDDINPNHACQVCHKTDSPEWILLCDECDCGYHCSCLKPIIFLIPSGNWFCPLCCHKKLVANLSEQLTQLDTLIYNIETIELKKERQKQVELNEQKLAQERRKQRAEAQAASKERSPSKGSSGSSGSDSSEDEPLGLYKLRKRNQAAAPSYRFNEYDELINSAIKRDMDGNKGAGNLGRGKDISTIIEAEQEDEQPDDKKDNEEAVTGDEALAELKKDDAESSGSDVIRSKSFKRKKKKKLNNLDVSSDEGGASDEDFKGSTPSSDSEVDEEDLSMSSVSESSLDMPKKKGKGRNIRKSTRNRETRTDRRFINDGETDSDDEPLVRAKRSKKKDSDEEEFDMNDDDDEEGSLAEDIDSEDLCDDTDTDESSDNIWPKKKKKRVASYDAKPRKAPKKKDDGVDKAFRAGISKKKVLKKSDNESEASVASGSEKGKRKTRGKKLLYLIEDDLDSDESDGIKPGVKRPETPPEEREMFFKKQEEIKRMLAAKDTEAAKKLAAPTIDPIHLAMEQPRTPPIPFSNEPASLSTIPKNVIESAKALDTDYNRIKPIIGNMSRGSLQSNDMNEEELARMMEEEDFAQHQLKLAGEAIARKKLLELEAKESEFAAFTKAAREKDWQPAPATGEAKKRSRKSKSSEKIAEEFPMFPKAGPIPPHLLPSNLGAPPMPPLIGSNMPPLIGSNMPLQHLHKPPMHQSIITNLMQQQPPHTSFNPMPPSLSSERPSVLSNFLSRPNIHPQQMKLHHSMPLDAYIPKNQPLPAQPYDESDEKKKGRRKKFTPLRTDLPEGNISKVAKLDQPSVIQPPLINPGVDRMDEKSKVPRPDHPKLAVAPPPQIFNPATNTTPSVITRLLQPQQRPGLGPYGQGFQEIGPTGENPSARMYSSPEDMKNSSPGKPRSAMPPVIMPQGAFGENPFVPRNIHPLYRAPPGYVMPPHARLPPYPFHHLQNLRPATPYNIPPQFSYYAPPAHSRPPPQSSAIPLNHVAPQHIAGPEDISNSIRHANNSEENPSETSGSSEFGGLVSYFSSQQELD